MIVNSSTQAHSRTIASQLCQIRAAAGVVRMMAEMPSHYREFLKVYSRTQIDEIAYRYGLNKDIIVTDLKNERPIWPLSAYGPGKDAPRQLFGGFPIEQSPEEMRVLYYLAQANGQPQPAVGNASVRQSIALTKYQDSRRTAAVTTSSRPDTEDLERSGRCDQIHHRRRQRASKQERYC